MKQIKLVYHGVVYSKKNSKRIIINRRTGRPQIISNAKSKQAEQDMAIEFYRQATVKYWKPSGNAEVKIVFYVPNHRRRDLDNMATTVLDALVEGGVLEDDSIDNIRRLVIESGGVDKDDPRAEITIKEEK